MKSGTHLAKDLVWLGDRPEHILDLVSQDKRTESTSALCCHFGRAKRIFFSGMSERHRLCLGVLPWNLLPGWRHTQ